MEQPKEEIMNRAYELGKKYELENGNCAQSTVAAVFAALGVDSEDVFRAATGLSDGIGLTGNGPCGALSAGAMAISYFYGRKKADFSNERKIIKACILSKKLHDEFLVKYGVLGCAELQKKTMGRFYNMYDLADYEASNKAGMRNYTSQVVGEVARMTTRIILEERERETSTKK